MPEPEENAVLPAPSLLPFRQAWWEITKIAIPMALSFTFTMQVMAVGVMAGKHERDENHQAAITLIITTMNTLVSLTCAPLFALSVVASKKVGDIESIKASRDSNQADMLLQKNQQVSIINRYGLMTSATLTAPSFLFLYFFADIMHAVFRQDRAVSEVAQTFLRPYAFALPGIYLRTVYEQMMFVKNKTVAAMLMGITTFAIGTAISIWLCFGWLGVKEQGYQGIAIGYVIESYLIAAAYALYARFHSAFKDFQLFRVFGFNRALVRRVNKEINHQAFAMTFAMGNELLLDFLMGVISGMISTVAQAAMSFVMQFVYCVFLLMAALGITNQIKVGQAVGAQQYAKASQTARYGVLVSLSWLLPPAVIIMAYPSLLQILFGRTSPEIAAISDKVARIVSVGIIFNAIRTTVLQQMRALKDTWASALISACCLWVGIALSALLGTQSSLSINGVAIGYSMGLMLAAAALTVPRWWRYSEQRAIQANAIKGNELSFSEALRYGIFHCGPKQSELDAEAGGSLLPVPVS